MILEGSFTVARPATEVWAALNDPAVLGAAIPGCEKLVRSETGYEATVALKIGPVKARFSGDVTIAEAVAPDRLVLTGEGSGGVAGFAKGTATVLLHPLPAGTTVVYTAEVAVGGKLAQIGNRLIASTARKLTDNFFESLNDLLSATQEAAP